ncbi:hypothetical protein FHT13_002216 [Xanthomonas arboricola]|nr:hypothetical protein [Xanthomonas arboricola]
MQRVAKISRLRFSCILPLLRRVLMLMTVPARSNRSRSGHYSDSGSIVAKVRRGAGLSTSEGVDIGLTRTLSAERGALDLIKDHLTR